MSDQPTRFEILLAEEVANMRVLLTQRGKDHGDAGKTFPLIAGLVSEMLRGKLRRGQRISAVNVLDMLALVKVVRLIETGNEDSRHDLAGYALLAGAAEGLERAKGGAKKL